MGQTLAEKIISEHAGHEVKAGELVIAKVDVTAVQDGTGPLTVQEFKKLGKDKLFNPERTILFIDHAAPSPRKELSNTHTVLRQFHHQVSRQDGPVEEEPNDNYRTSNKWCEEQRTCSVRVSHDYC